MEQNNEDRELPKAYEPKNVDNKWYTFWEEQGFFRADPKTEKPAYCISIPPPNVTGVLHMGHALVNTLQDILIRWKRMQGFETLWVPGTDHAGIATQTVVERHLIKETGKTRKEFDREVFLEHIWNWKEQSQERIIGQLKRIGASCDWSRLRFTMDEGCNQAVKTMFKKLYDQGMIYRGDYLVNWDPVTQTALADDEVEYEDRASFLWHFKYPLKDGQGFVHIATTRPETMLGDTAVAVSPSDERYKDLIGKTVVLPIMDREIPIIADHHVDPEFGTGMVKITPAHDPNDYTMGINHNLCFINIMTPDGKINENGGRFVGMTMAEAREAVVDAMKELGFLEKVEPHTNRVGVSYRSKAAIEPYMSKQWFVKMSDFAPKMRHAVESKKVKINPQTWENTYYHWIDNLRDWCISRQLWWGHRIPVWYRKDNRDIVICYDGEGLPPEVQKEPDAWEQDEDVLDTWFSSSLWPFSILGWPEKTAELDKFYPNAVLVTGHDILFFWVARMILMGEYALGEPPFPETFLHGLIYGKSYWRDRPDGGIAYLGDEERREYDLGKPQPKDVHCKWEKMSKTKGNIIDPLEIIDQYGTDAMRMALCASASQAREIDLDRRRFEEYKNFANKIWNGARFVFMNLNGNDPLTADEFSQGLNEELLKLEDRWILSVLNHTIKDVNKSLTNYQFDQAAAKAYDFYWKEFCSYYLEIVKPVLFGRTGTAEERKNKQKLLAILLCNALRLIHPIAPFISEELFQHLKEHFKGIAPNACDPYSQECITALQKPACIIAPYPEVIREADLNPEVEKTFETVGEVIYTIRNVRGEMQLSPGQATDIHIVGDPSTAEYATVEKNQTIISALVRTSSISFHKDTPDLGFASTGLTAGLKVMIPLPQQLLEQEKQRLEKERLRLESSRDRVRSQLANDSFVSRAPEHLVAQQRELLSKTETELEEVCSKLSHIR